MPQLDLTFFKENILFLIFSFGFFYFFLVYFILIKFFEIKDKRDKFFNRIKINIENNLKEIDLLKGKIDLKRTKNEELIKLAINKIEKEINNFRLNKKKDFTEKINTLKEENSVILNMEKQQISKEIENNFEKISNLIKKKIA